MSQIFAILSAFLVVIACSVEPVDMNDGEGSPTAKKNNSKDQKAESVKQGEKNAASVDEEDDASASGEEEEEDVSAAAKGANSPAPVASINVSATPAVVPSGSVSPSPAASPTGVLGLKNATVDPVDKTIAVFRIPAGTGVKAWNTADKMIEIDPKFGFKILRIYNDDTTTQTLHTNNQAPCGHQGQATATGAFFDCVIGKDQPNGDGTQTYSHGKNGNPAFFMKVVTTP